MRLGEIVVEQGLASAADVARGLARAAETGQRLGAALIELGLCDADGIATALAAQRGVPAARDKHFAAIAPETRALLSPASAERWCAVPIAVAVGAAPSLVIAMRDPDDAAAIDAITAETGYAIRPAVASERRIRAALGIAPTGAPPRPAGLGLAVAPRRRPTTAPPPRTRAASTAPPDGNRLGEAAARIAAATGASEPASRSGGNLGWLAGLAVALFAAGFDYYWLTRGGAEEVIGRYDSSFLNLEIALPGVAWHTEPSERDTDEGPQGMEIRGEPLYRGDSAHPDQALLLGRVSSPGLFPVSVDMDGFRAGLGSLQAQLGTFVNTSMRMSAVSCEVSTIRPEPIGVCHGRGDLGGASYGVVIYVWIANANDIVVVVYAERGELTRGHEAEAVVTSLRLR